MKSSLLVLASLLAIHTTWAADPPADTPGAPVIKHAPVTTVVRGQPAHIAADIQATPPATITSVVAFVRLTDVGTPMRYPMKGGPGDGLYATDVPVSLIRGVMRFWYHVHTEDSQGRIADTPWYPVNVIDGATAGGGAGGGGAWISGKNALIAGGILLVGGGGAALLLNEDDDGHDKSAPAGTTPPPAVPTPPKTTSQQDDDDDDEDMDHTPPPCVVTGTENVNMVSGSDNPFDPGNPIEFYVCGACSNATIRVVGSWGEENTVGPYNNPTCSPGVTIPLTKPPYAPPADSETIEIYSNGTLIHSLTWPDNSWSF